MLQSVESGNVVLDGGYVDLDPAKLASISTTNASSVSTTTCWEQTRMHQHVSYGHFPRVYFASLAFLAAIILAYYVTLSQTLNS